jgi:2-polyprenyl-6-methoxyphenol hydroxylase-like FAD-dependent oxidoreductase
MRKKGAEAGRSINLALSNRGIRALEEVGLADELKKVAIPMHGRMMHDKQGKAQLVRLWKRRSVYQFCFTQRIERCADE